MPIDVEAYEDELLNSSLCPRCRGLTVNANIDTCPFCDYTACMDCSAKHKEAHDQDEVRVTRREAVNAELKQQIYAQAQTLCRLIDNQESLVKLKEKEIQRLAEELDRRMAIQ